MLQGLRTTRHGEMRLDAGEQMWLKRELEYVDKKIYERHYDENIARQLIPTEQNVPDWATSVNWSEIESYGSAKIISEISDDIPRVGANRTESSQTIKIIADAYSWNVFDIKRAAATGIHLDTTKAEIARRVAETTIDDILAKGDAKHKLNGFARLSYITPVVATTKTGGGTKWSATATAAEIANDVIKLVTSIIIALKGARNAPVFRKFRVVMPDANFLMITTKKMGEYDSRTVFDYLMSIPYIESIVGWHQLVGQAANNTDDRMIAYAPDPSVVSGIVPMEWTPQEPEKRNLEYVVICLATCGGVITRYPIAIGYMDEIDATALGA